MKYLLICVFLPLSFFLAAQEEGERRNKVQYSKNMESQKVAYFTTKLDLSPEESQVFWPVYNEYSKQVKSIRAEAKKGKIKSGKSKKGQGQGEGGTKAYLDSITDEEAAEGIEQMMQLKEKELNLQRSYVEKFKEVLPTKKVLLLYHLENRFKEKMMRNIRKKLSGQKGDRKGEMRSDPTPEKN